jgi:glycosyltransferase involved in cell wall biosynthesis
MKVNIFHEWLDTPGGAESVLSELIEIFPNATLYTLWAESELVDALGVEVRVSFLQHFPRKFRRLIGLPFMPLAWHLLGRNVEAGQLSITSSWIFCHSAIPKRFEASSFHYIHTPARYWWNPDIDKRTQLKIPSLILFILRNIDKWLARNHQNVIANSEATRDRIKIYWNLDSLVIHPPVDVNFYDFKKIENNSATSNFLLCVGRFVPYKGHELAIKLGEKLNLPVVLVGHGDGETRLRKLSVDSTTEVSLLVNASRERIRQLYATCACLVYPAVEDFGIVPVEAMATGALVLGVNLGGLVDSVIQGETGILVPHLGMEALVEGFHSLPENSRENIRAESLRFSQGNFSIKIRTYLERMQNQ